MDLSDFEQNVAGVRRLTRGALSGISEDSLDDIVLVITELVSNAFEHGGSPRRLRLSLTARPCVVRCEVDDTVSALPVLGRSRLGDVRGRGMLLVDKLSASWGVIPGDGCKTVWAQFECEP